MTVPINKFVSAAAWSLGSYTVSGIVAAASAGLWFGYQISRGSTTPASIPGMGVITTLVNKGPLVIGLVGLILAIAGRLPAIHIERKTE